MAFGEKAISVRNLTFRKTTNDGHGPGCQKSMIQDRQGMGAPHVLMIANVPVRRSNTHLCLVLSSEENDFRMPLAQAEAHVDAGSLG